MSEKIRRVADWISKYEGRLLRVRRNQGQADLFYIKNIIYRKVLQNFVDPYKFRIFTTLLTTYTFTT